MRAGALARSSGSSSSVSRNGPRTFVAKVSSIPSADSVRVLGQDAGVVDEHVETVLAREELVREGRARSRAR